MNQKMLITKLMNHVYSEVIDLNLSLIIKILCKLYKSYLAKL